MAGRRVEDNHARRMTQEQEHMAPAKLHPAESGPCLLAKTHLGLDP